VPGPAVRAQRGDESEAVQVRHHHVGQHEVEGGSGSQVERLGAVAGGGYLPVRQQQPPDVVAQVGVVVHDQHPAGRLIDPRRLSGPAGWRGRLIAVDGYRVGPPLGLGEIEPDGIAGDRLDGGVRSGGR
jgi:hypothetical protein